MASLLAGVGQLSQLAKLWLAPRLWSRSISWCLAEGYGDQRPPVGLCSSERTSCVLMKIVEIHDMTPLRKRKIVEYRYHLLQAKSDDGTDSSTINLDSVADQSMVFLRAGHLVEIDSFLATHGPCGRLFGTCLAWWTVKHTHDRLLGSGLIFSQPQ